MLKLDMCTVEGRCCVALTGELDLETAAQLKKVVEKADGEILEIDLSQVSFVDSTGLKCLLDINNLWNQRGGRIIILNPKPEVAEVMELIGLNKLLDMSNK
ncbi:MAG TPA: anti-sigma factor antagonist [Peptococcaceae bacterium]|nr:MAG: Stage II sporulation protein [Clostridia bacterium 41_269]HBT20007.1 anti-sigma factor antagonist [Peptococcaceae bacterium]